MQKYKPLGFRKRFYMLLGIFTLTGMILYSVNHEDKSSVKTSTKPLNIQDNIADWSGTDVAIDVNTLNIIQPDAMIFKNFRNNKGETVNLYIGYYNIMETSDLAHSPLVCYPGQGWKVRQEDDKEIRLKGSHGIVKISQLTIEKGQDTELVWYWFQTQDYSTGSLGKMRMKLLWNKLSGRKTSNCFARLSVTVGNGKFSDGEKLLQAFMGMIHPQIYEYFKN